MCISCLRIQFLECCRASGTLRMPKIKNLLLCIDNGHIERGVNYLHANYLLYRESLNFMQSLTIFHIKYHGFVPSKCVKWWLNHWIFFIQYEDGEVGKWKHAHRRRRRSEVCLNVSKSVYGLVWLIYFPFLVGIRASSTFVNCCYIGARHETSLDIFQKTINLKFMTPKYFYSFCTNL